MPKLEGTKRLETAKHWRKSQAVRMLINPNQAGGGRNQDAAHSIACHSACDQVRDV